MVVNFFPPHFIFFLGLLTNQIRGKQSLRSPKVSAKSYSKKKVKSPFHLEIGARMSKSLHLLVMRLVYKMSLLDLLKAVPSGMEKSCQDDIQ